MRHLNLKVQVPADRTVTIRLPDEVEPGEADLTVVVRSRARPEAGAPWPEIHVEAWPADLSLRREDLCGDDGR